MSSAVVSTSAALRRPFLFDDDADSPAEQASMAGRRRLLQSTIHNQPSKIPPASITPASQLQARPAPEMVSSGIPELDALAGGLPRGCLTEICGPASSGRTTVLLAALAAATRRGEFCAIVDASDALDPQSLADSGVDLDLLLWVRCDESSPARNAEKGHKQKEGERRLEQVLRATDLLLESGGFGLIILDLADLSPQDARRIPLTTWFRFRRAVEHKPTILLAIEAQPIAGSCSSLLLQLSAAEGRKKIGTDREIAPEPYPTHARLLTGIPVNAELVRSRMDRKPAHSITFETTTAWAG